MGRGRPKCSKNTVKNQAVQAAVDPIEDSLIDGIADQEVVAEKAPEPIKMAEDPISGTPEPNVTPRYQAERSGTKKKTKINYPSVNEDKPSPRKRSMEKEADIQRCPRCGANDTEHIRTVMSQINQPNKTQVRECRRATCSRLQFEIEVDSTVCDQCGSFGTTVSRSMPAEDGAKFKTQYRKCKSKDCQEHSFTALVPV